MACADCGKPCERALALAGVRWCASCVLRRHAAICSQPARHDRSCDPPPGPFPLRPGPAGD